MYREPVRARAHGESESYRKITIGKALAFTRATSSSEVKRAELLNVSIPTRGVALRASCQSNGMKAKPLNYLSRNPDFPKILFPPRHIFVAGIFLPRDLRWVPHPDLFLSCYTKPFFRE